MSTITEQPKSKQDDAKPKNDAQSETEKPEKLFEFSLPSVLGGALAAATAAALGSRLGVTGTLVGAGVASVIAATASSVYTGSLKAAQRGVKTLWAGRSDSPVEVTVQMEPIDPASDAPTVTDVPAQPPAKKRRGWAIAATAAASMVVTAAASFAIAMGVVTGTEAATGQSLDGSGRTTIQQATNPSPTPTPTPTTTPSSGSSTTPSSGTSQSPASEPTATTSPEPTSPTPTPSTATPTPSASDSVSAPEPSAS